MIKKMMILSLVILSSCVPDLALKKQMKEEEELSTLEDIKEEKIDEKKTDPKEILSPIIKNINVSYVTRESAYISFFTNEETRAEVKYGRMKILGDSVFETFKEYHRIHLINLKPGTKYFFNINTVNRLRKKTISQIYEFTTNEPIIEMSDSVDLFCDPKSIRKTKCTHGKKNSLNALITDICNSSGSAFSKNKCVVESCIDGFELLSNECVKKEKVVNIKNIKSFPVGTTFYWQLQGKINQNHNVDMYDIDLEDNYKSGIIKNLQSKGYKVVCYFSAGSYESWRSDENLFPKKYLGRNLDGWPGEKWLDIRSKEVRSVIAKRIDLAAKSGCDAIEPDNVDGYQNNNGFNLTKEDQINFLHWISEYAHKEGLSIGLKNSLDIIKQGQLAKHFDWALNEQCYQYKECAVLKEFVKERKAVFIAEYKKKMINKCSDAKKNGFSLVVFDLNLKGSYFKQCI